MKKIISPLSLSVILVILISCALIYFAVSKFSPPAKRAATITAPPTIEKSIEPSPAAPPPALQIAEVKEMPPLISPGVAEAAEEPVKQPEPVEEPEETPPPPQPVSTEAESIDLGDDSAATQETAFQKTPILKKIDISRIGAAPYYEEFQGLRLAKYFTVAQRVEIYEEPKPIDAYIMDAKKIRYLHAARPWNQASEFRSQIAPIFTRAYGTEITISDPEDREGQIRYTHDYREIYNNQFPIYFEEPTRNVNYKHEMWEQNEILLMHSKRIPGIDWNYTSNLGYRYSNMNAKNDGSTFAYHENRHTYIANLSVAPDERFEMFGQFEYFKSKRPDANYIYNPDHYFYAAELRMRSKDMKTSYIPRVSYSIDEYYPFYNRFKKYETQVRVGRDFTKKFNGTTTFRYVLSDRNEVDNTAPSYAAPNPINDMAAWVGTENRAQYNIYDRLWLQGGLDLSAGTNMSDFDNWGLLAGLEYYAPGMIRIDFGWRGNHYYNIEDYLSSVYFKFYLFM